MKKELMVFGIAVAAFIGGMVFGIITWRTTSPDYRAQCELI